MPVISRLVSIPLRVGEVAFALVVTGIIASYIHNYTSTSNMPHPRFIYTLVVSSLSALLGLIWLIPFSGGFITWTIDVVLSLCWFASFGLLVHFTRGACNARAFDWGGITAGGTCNRWRAAQAFAFLSAIFWLASAIVGVWFTRRERRNRNVKYDSAPPRRGWFGRSRV